MGMPNWESLEPERNLDAILPDYSSSSIEANPTGPQSQAYQWLLNDLAVTSYSTDQRLQLWHSLLPFTQQAFPAISRIAGMHVSAPTGFLPILILTANARGRRPKQSYLGSQTPH